LEATTEEPVRSNRYVRTSATVSRRPKPPLDGAAGAGSARRAAAIMKASISIAMPR